MLKIEHIVSDYFKTILPLKITSEEEEQLEQTTICWLCEEPFNSSDTASLALHTESTSREKVRDHDQLTGEYRGAAHNICNINSEQKSSSFVPIIFHNFSGYGCHLVFEQLSTQAYKMGYEPKIIPKSMENYVSVQVGCLRFLDSYCFLSSGLDRLVKSLDNFPILDSNNFKEKFLEDDLLKKKLAYPYEYLTLSNFQQRIKFFKKKTSGQH